MSKADTTKSTELVIKAPNLHTAAFEIVGAAPYVQHRFSAKAQAEMIAKQKAGTQAQSKKKREPKDFDAVYLGAMHKSADGWIGIPAPAFRNAMIDACRLVNFKMTHAKLSVFVLPDGFDEVDGTPLVRITHGEPRRHTAHARNDSGVVDIRVRPMWDPGWRATVRVRWDGDQFGAADVFNLLLRAGQQVGIGEGRPSSKKSAGLGWGLFDVDSEIKTSEQTA
jgi:hypothetical protein